MKYYPALMRKTRASDFGIEFPDFPGCVTAAKSAEEATKMAEQALAFHVDGMRDDGEPIPEPSDLEEVLKSDSAKDAAVLLVPLARSKGRAIRFNATMDEFLLERVDRTAKEFGMTRSALLATAARQYLATADPLEAVISDAVEEGRGALAGVGDALASLQKTNMREHQPPDSATIGHPGGRRA